MNDIKILSKMEYMTMRGGALTVEINDGYMIVRYNESNNTFEFCDLPANDTVSPFSLSVNYTLDDEVEVEKLTSRGLAVLEYSPQADTSHWGYFRMGCDSLVSLFNNEDLIINN